MSADKDEDTKNKAPEHTGAPPDDGSVGYKHPPVAHQFKKGVCPNPRGRPCKVERSYTPRQYRRDILRIGNRPTTIKTDRGAIRLTLVEAMLLKTAYKGLSGHGPSNRLFLREYSEALQEHSEIHDKNFSMLELMETEFVFKSGFADEWGRKELNKFRKLTRRT